VDFFGVFLACMKKGVLMSLKEYSLMKAAMLLGLLRTISSTSGRMMGLTWA
jgi:hypothetical protein